MTINEGLIHLKSLRERHAELVSLRNANANERTRFFGAHGDKEVKDVPTYDVKKVDRLVTTIAAEIRKVETAIKATNAIAVIPNYTPDDTVFGQVE